MSKLSVKNNFLMKLFFFSAIFNDLIRIPGTVLSLYRILVLLLSILCIMNYKDLKLYFIWFFSFIFLLIIQNFVFINTYGYESKFDFSSYFTYLFHYYSILILFMIIKLVRVYNKPLFAWIFDDCIPTACIIMAVVYALIPLLVNLNLFVANRNNYAVGLAVTVPVLLILRKNKKFYIFLVFIIFFELFLYGSKSACVGIGLEIVLFFLLENSSLFKYKKPIMALGAILMIILARFIINSSFSINGYSIQKIFNSFVLPILNRQQYLPESYTSLTYRTDAVIAMLNSIARTPVTGIGAHNTAKLLLYSLPARIGSSSATALSPHCAYLEFMSDNGIWATLLCIVIYFKAIKKFFGNNILGCNYKYFVILVISLPIWMLSASGIYTIYVFFICAAWILESTKEK